MPLLHGWRLVLERHRSQAFQGIGASRFGARWNHKGYPAVYAGASASLAVLEVFVNGNLDTFRTHKYFFIGFTLDVPGYRQLQLKDLPAGWRQVPAPRATKDVGTQWLQKSETPVLIVPSSVVPQDENLIINPRHPELIIKSVEDHPFEFSTRMLW